MIKQKLLPVILFVLFCSTLSAQSNTPRIRKTILQVWEEIFASQEEDYIVNNIDIVVNQEASDSLFFKFQEKHTVQPMVHFGEPFQTPNIRLINEYKGFEAPHVNMIISNVTFEHGIAFWRLPDLRDLSFFNCTFNGSLTWITAPEQNSFLGIEGCQFNKRIYLNCASAKNSSIAINQTNFDVQYKDVMRLSTITGNDQTDLWMQKVKFTNTNPDKSWISFENAFSSIKIDSCDFGMDLVLNNVNLTKNFIVSNSTFINISMSDMVLPPADGISVDWKQISEKLCVISTRNAFVNDTGYTVFVNEMGKTDSIIYYGYSAVIKDPLFTGKEDSLMGDMARYDKLVANYYSFLRIYKERGGMESANKCFVEVKDIQTRRMKYEYKKNPTISTFFIWRTNQFLKYFSDYGTNPSKAVIISFYVILIFGGFYFFFYSQWDRINKDYFVRRYTALSKYLSSQTTLAEFYRSSNQKQIKTFEEFKNSLKAKQQDLPKYVILLGHLFHKYSTSRYRFVSWLIDKLDVQKGLWKDLKSGKKFLVGSIIGITILIFVVYTLLIKSLSAVMLSLNAFSTLGFGNIPVKGFSKYLTVVEGFLGWLLLSIFSVCLVAQIIQ